MFQGGFVSENKKIGLILTGAGSIFLVLGVIFFFNTRMLILGNFLFICGMTVLIGVKNTLNFFFRMKRIKGTICFIGGMFTVLYGWPIIGVCVELFGFINLFGDFFPSFLAWLQHIFPSFFPSLISKLRKLFSRRVLPE